MVKVAIMLGGNLPETPNALKMAQKRLLDGGFMIEKCSKVMVSAAEDCVPGTPDFLDMALCGSWHGSAMELLKLCQSIEIALGRPAQHSSRESRIIDLDIILFGSEVIKSEVLTIPHPRAAQREFVLRPLNEIAPEWLFPDRQKTVSELFAALNKQ
ncbi:MAG: 2-amino-4-hydroxy-6-hydroxymethyldihydropteridine diphosphokinase [Lentisphaeria bacterium]|nr:2-amino-4-hydroxy-6-hydroxymethyldihydropteridine diphosphokinase [Lentisphaeria bacterium]